jgi:hypothetical protein
MYLIHFFKVCIYTTGWNKIKLVPKYIKNYFILHTYSPIKMEQTGCTETLAFKLQTLENHTYLLAYEDETDSVFQNVGILSEERGECPVAPRV